MKILVICQYYYPEPFRISDICETLVEEGNEVTVVTGVPNYPMGEIYPGYENKKKQDKIINGVKVHRCFTIPRGTGTIKRFLNYYSFCFSSKKYVKKMSDEFDVVFVNQLSPVMMAYAGMEYKKKYNKKLFLYCLDLWPESLTAGGIKKNSLIYKFFYKISKSVYKKADKIFVTSKSFIKYFENNFDIESNTIEYLPQYAESLFNINECRKIPNDTTDLLFAGNIGKAQSVETIIEAANLLKSQKNIKFHIVGDGISLDSCIVLSKKYKLKNITFYGRKPLDEMPNYYKKADAMLITLDNDEFASLTLPGKIQTYMSAGKPIIGAINGDAADVIKEAKCGFCGKAECVDELVKNIEKFVGYKDKEKLGKNAYEYYKNNFSKDKFIDTLLKELEENK